MDPVGADTPTVKIAHTPDWCRLQEQLTGPVVVPGDENYELARQLHHRQFDGISPSAVAYPETDTDVARSLRFAVDNDVQVAIRSGGHSLGGYSTGYGLVVDLSRMNSIGVDTGRDVVRLGAGVQQIDALDRLDWDGLAVVGGLCATVCVSGYVLGGGIGWQTKSAGVAADRLVSAKIVLADGTVVTCSETEEPDLFWALRGAGAGNFGVVTELELLPVRIPRMVNHMLTWDWEHAAAILLAWQRWVRQAPHELGSTIAVVLPDASPETVPQIILQGAWQGSEAEARACLDELIRDAGVQPSSATFEELPYRQAMMSWYQCSDKTVEQCHRIGTTPEAMLPRDVYVVERNRLCADVPTDGIDAVLTAFEANRRAGHFRAVSLFGHGGQANAVPRSATAYVHRTAEFQISASTGLFSDPEEEDRAAAAEWVNGCFAAFDAHSLGESYQNFVDPALKDWQEAYYAENLDRLVRVKQKYDPEHVFRFPQGIR